MSILEFRSPLAVFCIWQIQGWGRRPLKRSSCRTNLLGDPLSMTNHPVSALRVPVQWQIMQTPYYCIGENVFGICPVVWTRQSTDSLTFSISSSSPFKVTKWRKIWSRFSNRFPSLFIYLAKMLPANDVFNINLMKTSLSHDNDPS